MSPLVLLLILLACLLALIPVWRLHVAGWSRGSLASAWVLYAIGIFMTVRFTGAMRFLVPILVLAYVAPFVAGPERLTRLMGRRRRAERTIIDVTPKQAPGLPEPPRDVTPRDVPPPDATPPDSGGDAHTGDRHGGGRS